MTLSSWNASKTTIRILARQNKAHASFRVDAIQTAVSEGGHCDAKDNGHTDLSSSARQLSAQYVNRVSISPHSSPATDPSGFCKDTTKFTVASLSIASNASRMTRIWREEWSVWEIGIGTRRQHKEGMRGIGEHLNRGQCVEQMRIVRYIPAETSGGVPTAQDKLNHFVAIHFLGAAHDFHR